MKFIIFRHEIHNSVLTVGYTAQVDATSRFIQVSFLCKNEAILQ